LERDPNNTFNVLREAVGAWAGKPVSEPIYESNEPLIVEIYYLIQDQHIDPELGHREQIIIRIKVNERKNIAILSVAAEENSTVTGVITHIWQLAEVAFQKTYNLKLRSLRCPYCGDTIESLEETQEKIKCKYCKTIFEKNLLEKN
jgi:predicted Zn-ribbon and HTH transcriptional regulator